MLLSASIIILLIYTSPLSTTSNIPNETLLPVYEDEVTFNVFTVNFVFTIPNVLTLLPCNVVSLIVI